MPEISLAIIDGTGDFKNKNYAASMQHGFCKQLDRPSNQMASYYQRGPWALGLEDAYYMNNALSWLLKQSEPNPNTRLMLAGYSRGASTVLTVAAKLKDRKKSVDSMFLFDAVSRQLLIESSKIVDTVKFCRHAVRSDDPDLVDKYESYVIDTKPQGGQVAIPNPVKTNKMRPWFGHVALTAPPGVDFAMQRSADPMAPWRHGLEGRAGRRAGPTRHHGLDEPLLKARGVPVGLYSPPPSS